MNTLAFKSPHDGAVLSLSITRRTPAATEFEVAVRTPWFAGRTKTSTYDSGSPAKMFAAMASESRGWAGQKQWQDIEGEVSLRATADATGHIELNIEMRRSSEDSLLKVRVQYEAGQLEDMARAVSALFEMPSSGV